MPFDPDVFKKALVAAREAAEAVDVPDDGTCCLDSPYVIVPRIRAEKISALGKEAGVDLGELEYFGRRAFSLQVVFGQANLRTKKAEAARKALEPFEEAGGFESGVYYMMD